MIPTALSNSEVIRFGPLDIHFGDSVLRPRPWTIAQSMWAEDLLMDAPDGPVLELCSGAGQMGLLLASLVSRNLVLVDVDVDACSYASANARAAGVSGRVDVRVGLMDAMLTADERFTLILADPPWVPSDETMRFPMDPLLAIDGGKDGLDVARICVEVIGRHLVDGGVAILQLGDGSQVSAMSSFLAARPAIGLHVEEIRTFAGDGVLVSLVQSGSASTFAD